jgi:hypothetical protein
MAYVLDGAWLLVKFMSLGSLAVALAGVAIFGWYFVRINARAVRNDTSGIPRAAWRGRGAIFGLKVFASGAAMQIASIALSAVLPGRL